MAQLPTPLKPGSRQWPEWGHGPALYRWKRTASVGRLRSIPYRAGIGSSGWIADLRRDAISATGAAPVPTIPSDYCRAIAMRIASSGETR
jgi:hypothetical protein